MRICERCHEEVTKQVKTSEGDPYCNRCGYVFGMCVSPSIWACECGNVVQDHGGDERPMCDVCDVPMNCYRATTSKISGVGIGDADLDQGLALLLEGAENVHGPEYGDADEKVGYELLIESQTEERDDSTDKQPEIHGEFLS